MPPYGLMDATLKSFLGTGMRTVGELRAYQAATVYVNCFLFDIFASAPPIYVDILGSHRSGEYVQLLVP